jgi:hypothetical protein
MGVRSAPRLRSACRSHATQLILDTLGAHTRLDKTVFLGQLKIKWRYAAGEIAIIVVGVLLAISLDSCNEARIARRTEKEYLTRLAEDLRTDTATFNFVDRALARKTAALSFADNAIGGTRALADTLKLFQALVYGANFSWNQPRVRTTTFEELQSTGNLRLLRDPNLRAQVVRYYTAAEGDYLRIAGRRTRYGPLTYELVPRKSEFLLDSAASRAQSQFLVEALMNSDIKSAILAERNLATFVAEMNVGLQQRALELLRALEATS